MFVIWNLLTEQKYVLTLQICFEVHSRLNASVELTLASCRDWTPQRFGPLVQFDRSCPVAIELPCMSNGERSRIINQLPSFCTPLVFACACLPKRDSSSPLFEIHNFLPACSRQQQTPQTYSTWCSLLIRKTFITFADGYPFHTWISISHRNIHM